LAGSRSCWFVLQIFHPILLLFLSSSRILYTTTSSLSSPSSSSFVALYQHYDSFGIITFRSSHSFLLVALEISESFHSFKLRVLLPKQTHTRSFRRSNNTSHETLQSLLRSTTHFTTLLAIEIYTFKVCLDTQSKSAFGLHAIVRYDTRH
jgi:hypothetical protein